MKVCVLGAGVVGISTAYALARLGHEVTVIDKAREIASGASHANGAQLSYSYIDPFAQPQTLKKLPSYLLGRDPGIRLAPSLSPSYISWGVSFISQCRQDRADKNRIARLELARLSQAALDEYEAELPSGALKRSGRGKFVLAYSSDDFNAVKQEADIKNKMGLAVQPLSRAECEAIEPALQSWQTPFAGGLYCETDSTLDPLIYCRALAAHGQTKYGVKFRLGTIVKQINRQPSGFSILTQDGELACDIAIICAGNGVNSLIQPFRIHIPIYPVQGYSLTLPKGTTELTSSVTDPKYKIVFAKLKDSIRIAGFMDTNQSYRAGQIRAQQLQQYASTLWPDIAAFDSIIEPWTDYRPMLPSGVPIVAQTKVEGLYINAGHGALGYTFAAGCAAQLADIIGAP